MTRRVLAESDLPVMEISGSDAPSPARYAGWGGVDDRVTAVHVVHGVPDGEGPLVHVVTSRWSGTNTSYGPLRMMLEHHLRLDGQYLSSVDWVAGETTVLVDGEALPAERLGAGDRWWAVRCERDDIEITVIARTWATDQVAVTTVADPQALPRRSRPRTRAGATVQPAEPPPAGADREPHRALVDLHLEFSRRNMAWLKDGGPVPAYPAHAHTMWQAAVQRQMELAGQDRTDADRAMSTLVSHLCTLQGHAAWFRDDARLREQAIIETLFHATGLDPDVASRPAHLAWDRDRGGVEWLRAWAAWADDQAAR